MKTWIKLSRAVAAAAALMLTAPAASLAVAQEAPASAAASEMAAPESVAASESAAAPAEAPAAERALLASQKPLELNNADTTYLIFCTAMVLMMTLPGLALFYGGMVRKKNIVATVTQSVAVTCVVGIVWFVVSYSMAFGTATAIPWLPFSADKINLFMGGFDNLFLTNVNSHTAYSAKPTIPELTWVSYQLTFAIITPALITGAFAERVKFSGLLLFMILWSILVYAPICHMAWGGGLMGQMGVLDFAGGAVVHCNSGVAGLVSALFLGRRKGYGTEQMAPNNVIFIMIGAALLFVGWIGFNAGSEWSGDEIASAALFNTILCTCVAGVSWKIVEWIFRGKPSLVGILSGMVAGLVVITPACGFVNPVGAFWCGVAAGPVCYISATWIKKLLGYDDSLDAFGIHGAGGFLGAVLTGVFADPAINSLGHSGVDQVITQLKGLGITIVWSAVGTLLILIICKFTTGLRVSEADELAGLDSSQHDEVLDH